MGLKKMNRRLKQNSGLAPLDSRPGTRSEPAAERILLCASCTRDNAGMRKHIVNSASLCPDPTEDQEWLHLQDLAQVEVTSEDSDHPMELAFSFGQAAGWHAASPGKQSIRLIFDQPRSIKRIYLRFNES